jgi:hypothetical protein
MTMKAPIFGAIIIKHWPKMDKLQTKSVQLFRYQKGAQTYRQRDSIPKPTFPYSGVLKYVNP